MFGGLAFLLEGKMVIGVNKNDLVVRIDPASYSKLLDHPHAREMDFTGRSMKGFLYVSLEGAESESDVSFWVDQAEAFVLKTFLKP